MSDFRSVGCGSRAVAWQRSEVKGHALQKALARPATAPRLTRTDARALGTDLARLEDTLTGRAHGLHDHHPERSGVTAGQAAAVLSVLHQSGEVEETDRVALRLSRTYVHGPAHAHHGVRAGHRRCSKMRCADGHDVLKQPARDDQACLEYETEVTDREATRGRRDHSSAECAYVTSGMPPSSANAESGQMRAWPRKPAGGTGVGTRLAR